MNWLVLRVIQTLLAAISFITAAILLLVDLPTGLYWLVPGFFFSFVAGVSNAWVLLIEILR